MLLNALVKSIFRCKIDEKRAKNMLPKVRVAADSKLCCPLASFRPRRIPNLASLIAVPSDANLTVTEGARSDMLEVKECVTNCLIDCAYEQG